MNLQIKTCIAALAIVTGGLASAQSSGIPGLPKLGQGALRDDIAKLKAVKKLPVQGLSILETTDGKVVLVSDNGRFAVVGGRWIDLFENKVITSIEDSKSLDKLDFARMGIDIEEFDPITIGRGPKQVIAFIDPQCEQCQSLVRQMQSLASSYTFKVIVLPYLNKESAEIATRLHCSVDKSLALNALVSNSYSSLPKPEKCNPTPIEKGMIASKILGIRSVPLLVLPDATTVTARSQPVQLNQLLAQK